MFSSVLIGTTLAWCGWPSSCARRAAFSVRSALRVEVLMAVASAVGLVRSSRMRVRDVFWRVATWLF